MGHDLVAVGRSDAAAVGTMSSIGVASNMRSNRVLTGKARSRKIFDLFRRGGGITSIE